MNDSILADIKKIKSIADIGLLYCDNEYDKARYLELQEISFQVLSKVSDADMETLKLSFPRLKIIRPPKLISGDWLFHLAKKFFS